MEVRHQQISKKLQQKFVDLSESQNNIITLLVQNSFELERYQFFIENPSIEYSPEYGQMPTEIMALLVKSKTGKAAQNLNHILNPQGYTLPHVIHYTIRNVNDGMNQVQPGKFFDWIIKSNKFKVKKSELIRFIAHTPALRTEMLASVAAKEFENELGKLFIEEQVGV